MITPVETWRNNKKLSTLINRKGKIISFTKVTTAPEGFESQVPYTVAIIQLVDGSKIPLQIVDTEVALKTGQKVVTVIRRGGRVSEDQIIEYIIKARPI